METYDIFVDERGTIGSDQDDDPFAVGYFIAEHTDAAGALTEAIRAEFPNPFRLDERRRKVEDAARLAGVVPRNAAFFGGAVVFPDPEHPWNGLGDVVASRYPGLSTGPREDPATAAAWRDEIGRLLFCYEAALRVTFDALVDVLMTPRTIRVCLHLGMLGRPARHAMIAGELAKLEPTFARGVAAGLVPKFDARVEIELDGGAHAFHELAGLCASVGWHLMKESADAAGLVSATRELFAPGAPAREQLARGVTVLRPLPSDVIGC